MAHTALGKSASASVQAAGSSPPVRLCRQPALPPPVSFVAIGLFVATIGFSIGLDADIFRDVAAKASGAGSRFHAPDPLSQARIGLIEPMRNVYGVADKILAMAMSGILIGAADVRPSWLEVGVQLIAVDTLVHNFLPDRRRSAHRSSWFSVSRSSRAVRRTPDRSFTW